MLSMQTDFVYIHKEMYVPQLVYNQYMYRNVRAGQGLIWYKF